MKHLICSKKNRCAMRCAQRDYLAPDDYKPVKQYCEYVGEWVDEIRVPTVRNDGLDLCRFMVWYLIVVCLAAITLGYFIGRIWG